MFRVWPLKLIATRKPSVRLGLPANRCPSGGEQTLVAVTSSWLLVKQEVKCARPALTRGVGVGVGVGNGEWGVGIQKQALGEDRKKNRCEGEAQIL